MTYQANWCPSMEERPESGRFEEIPPSWW